ncbi:hypothetical protein MBLNU457_6336t1 [Dothideomycetes sp. NU457]
MWRDRTNLYISYRQSYAHHPAKKSRIAGGFGENGGNDEESRGLMSAGAYEDGGDAIIEMDQLPPRWLDIQDEVNEKLTQVTKTMKTLEQLTQKHVLPGFDDESVKKREEKDIEAMTRGITQGFQSCQQSIRRIDRLVKESAQSGGITRGEETMAKNLQTSLATKVADVSTLFRKRQTAYLKKMRALGGMDTSLDRVSTPAQNPYTDPSLMETESDRTSAQTAILQTKQMKRQTGLHDSVISQREREIEQIAQGVIDLANIFQELNSMVIDQGTMLDRIDYNVERMATDVKEAHKELKVATGYQKKTTKRKVILLLILLVVGVFILILVKPRRQASTIQTEPPPPPVQPPPDTHLRLRRSDSSDLPWTRIDWRRRRRIST